MKLYANLNRFFFYLTVFSGAMLGLVLSYNMLLLFVFWELTSFLSFFLISFFNEKETARKAAFQSLFITGFGGLSLLIGILLIGSIAGSYELTDWEQNTALITNSKLYLPALLFILIGVFTKSAQFPFHFWLPGAMQAPTPVSSYLHSATMVKAGVFLLMRLNPVLGGTYEWVNIISVVGAITFLTGAYFSITQTDIKNVLAYTTISSLGLLVMLMGIDTKYSVKAALVFLLVHAFYKATLFMIAGIIDKKAGTRDINKLGQLFKQMPLLSVLSILALLSMAGLPPMLGFIGKELVYEAKVQTPGVAYIALFTSIASNVIMVTVSLFLVYKLFVSKSNFTNPLGKPGFFMISGPVVLVTLSLFLGLFPGKLNGLI
jgi:multicomponent Na+:H+ antiporter subunit A